MGDDDAEEGSSESVSSFGEGEGAPGNKNKEDYTIRNSDALIVVATAEDDHSNLEVYIYDHKNSNLYVHHELILSSYPLCLEWLPKW